VALLLRRGRVSTGEKGGSASRDYMKQLQEELSPDKYAAFTQMLKDYRMSKNSHALIDGAVELLRPKQYQHLLRGFHDWVPKADRNWLRMCIR
jgi:hypothetical protein